MKNICIPSKEEFIRGVEEFEKRWGRGAMYKVATFLVSHFWGKPAEMADGLGVLLLTWNRVFYQYGEFDFDELEKCIERNLKKLENFRKRNITTLSKEDEREIENLFNDFMEALKIASGRKRGRKSPVAVAKALHILAPNFFPLWDYRIAKAYGCHYNVKPSKKYVSFLKIMKKLAIVVKDYVKHPNKPLLKLIDEYNFSKYTRGLIK